MLTDTALTPSLIESLRILSDGEPHDTWKQRSGRFGRLNGNVASRLYSLGLATIDRCDACGHSSGYVITDKGVSLLEVAS